MRIYYVHPISIAEYVVIYVRCGRGVLRVSNINILGIKNEFNKRGMYITYLTPRDGSDRSTKLTVNASFEAATVMANARLCVCDSFREICRVVIKDGRCIDVQIEQA